VKHILRLFFVFLLLSSLSFLTACDEEGGLTVQSIEIDEQTLLESYELGAFDLSSVRLLIRYSDNTTESMNLDPSMIDENDLIKLTRQGVHEITVRYDPNTHAHL